MHCVKKGTIVTKQMTNKKLGVAKLQLAFWCNRLWRYVKLAVYRHDRAQNRAMHLGCVYCTS